MSCWLVPCNVKNFDIVQHFEKNDTAYFKKNRSLSVGDTVYIYVASPYSAIKYKGKVVKTGIQPSTLPEYYNSLRYDNGTFVEIQKEVTFLGNDLSREVLKKIGIGQVVNQQSISNSALALLLKAEKSMEVTTNA